jgi:pimeloyl-ACP methyl ester carboxylesterase/AraC-like DNA-binding protein
MRGGAEPPMDVLTDILASLRLTGGVVIDAETSGDFCLLSRFTDSDRERFQVSGDLIAYHFVRSGRVFAAVDGAAPVEAKCGDIILLPRNDLHLLYSRPGLRPVDSHELLQQSPSGPAKIVAGQGGEPTELYCGFLGVSTENHPLLGSLPPILKLEGGDDASEDWVESSMRLLNEGRHSPEVVARVAELFFAESIRRYMDQLPSGEGGWLAGLRDTAVSKALSMIHKRYAEELDVEMLAREAGVSRTILGERFAELLGEPPMRYCARWRMRIAANMLRDGKQSTANIAYSVGFNSEAAFNRAFKREYGEPPATWRRRIEAEARAEEPVARSGLPEQVVRYCTAHDGTRLAFSMVGEGPPLVKSANWLNHIEHDWESPVWRHWLKELTTDHCLVRYDERGNGLSDWDTPEISFEAFVDDLETVVDCAGLEQFDLLGISQGAGVAIAYAVRHPGKVRKLVLCGGYATGWAVRQEPDETARREAMITLSATGWGADNPAYRQLFTNLYIPGASATQQQWFNEVQRVSASPENAVKLQRTFSTIDVRDLLPKVTTPTIVFHARGDKAIPFAAGEYLAANIPGAVFIPLESNNHILLESDAAWQAFVRATREFLKKDAADLPRAKASPAMPASERIEYCESADETRIAYAVAGEGFPLVKAPNWMTNLSLDPENPVYRHWLVECSRGNRFIRSDMRGFGMSEHSPRRFDFEAIVDDLAAVIDGEQVEQCDLLGVSHGAAVAMAYAARFPERVRKLILVNSFAAGWRVRGDPDEIAWRESLWEMNSKQMSFRRSALGEMFITLYFPSATNELIEWHNEHLAELGPNDILEPMIDLASWIDVRDELAKIRAPTLVAHAVKDGNAPLAAGRAVADGIAGARFVELDSANHILLGDEPAWREFTREMRAFLAAEMQQPQPVG